MYTLTNSVSKCMQNTFNSVQDCKYMYVFLPIVKLHIPVVIPFSVCMAFPTYFVCDSHIAIVSLLVCLLLSCVLYPYPTRTLYSCATSIDENAVYSQTSSALTLHFKGSNNIILFQGGWTSGRTRVNAIGKAGRFTVSEQARRFRGMGLYYSQLTSQSNVHYTNYIQVTKRRHSLTQI